jgi:hypothetical protein
MVEVKQYESNKVDAIYHDRCENESEHLVGSRSAQDACRDENKDREEKQSI